MIDLQAYIEKTKKERRDTCPFCGSRMVDWGDMTPVEYEFIHEIPAACECGKTWVEKYKLFEISETLADEGGKR